MHNYLQKNKQTNIKAIKANANAIGVMDSGVGGLTVMQHIHRLLPHEHLNYVADSQYAPYGSLSPESITDRCFTIADFLIEQNVKALVVACNTATAASIQLMRAKYALPIIGMEPAVKPAALASKNGIIGVLATVGTLKSAQFAALLTNYGQDIQVHTQGCIGLVECIERGEIHAASTKALIAEYCAPLLEAGADTIVLGCTHYPFVRDVIQGVVGEGVTVIDTGEAVAKHLQATLEVQSLLTSIEEEADVLVWTNNTAADRDAVIQQLWGDNAVVRRIALR
jgi:glutamate racemase|tara:strand:+ start:2358 stop:3203 length:846 start_codon:yes stop_codon:yes gene_type:complete